MLKICEKNSSVNLRLEIFVMAFRVRKLFGTFEKRAPGIFFNLLLCFRFNRFRRCFSSVVVLKCVSEASRKKNGRATDPRTQAPNGPIVKGKYIFFSYRAGAFGVRAFGARVRGSDVARATLSVKY